MRKAFIWQDIEHVSISYHNGGGVLVVASSLERAREKLHEHFQAESNDAVGSYGEDWLALQNKCEAFTRTPDITLSLADSEDERVLVFENAGCC